MLLRRFTDFILRNRINGMGAAFMFSLIPVIGGSISILIVGLITLRKGAYEGTLVFIASILPYVLNYVTYPAATTVQMEVVFIATMIVIVINMLTWFLALMLRSFNNWGLTLEAGALAGVVAVMLVHLFYPDVTVWWGQQLTAYSHKTASVLAQLMPPSSDTMSKGMTPGMISVIKNYATGFSVASLLVNALLQLVIARWWQAAMFNPGGLQTELHQIRLSYVSALIFILAIISWNSGNPVGTDVLPVITVVFGAAGLSLLHALVAANKAGWFWLTLVYLGVMFLFPLGIASVAMAALVDTVFDFRKRLRRNKVL